MATATDRQGRIAWWNQDVIRGAHIAVMGAGALGNEVIKNLALQGVGRISIFDFDQVEESNLSRTLVSVRVTHPVLRRDLVMHLIHERSGSGAEAA
jgi:tRNA A37 threonylcarbamoyladenosine dehydratase